MKRSHYLLFSGAILVTGCTGALEEQTKPTGRILGKKTQEVAEFDPAKKQEVSDSKNPEIDMVGFATGLSAAQALGPALERITKIQIKHTVDAFNALEGRYPKDHAEFMAKIIKANRIRLPKLPGGHTYAYDVKNHELVVLKAPAEKKAEQKKNE